MVTRRFMGKYRVRQGNHFLQDVGENQMDKKRERKWKLVFMQGLYILHLKSRE